MPPEAKRKDLGQELVKAGLDFAYRAVKRKRKSISLKKS
jgi:hypothetical protein